MLLNLQISHLCPVAFFISTKGSFYPTNSVGWSVDDNFNTKYYFIPVFGIAP
jgi:hypothetical protein